jgi:hypothetical protein
MDAKIERADKALKDAGMLIQKAAGSTCFAGFLFSVF